MAFKVLERVHLKVVARCSASSSRHLSLPLVIMHLLGARCTGLVKVVLYDGFLQIIRRYAFGYCSSLSRIDIPPSITSIEDSAFAWCTTLVKVVFHEGLNKLEILHFVNAARCSMLTSHILSQTFDICGYAFSVCAVSIPRRPHRMEG